jgi:hypothetical protein
MDEPTTCGQGLAASAPVPAKLGVVVTALADVLEAAMVSDMTSGWGPPPVGRRPTEPVVGDGDDADGLMAG